MLRDSHRNVNRRCKLGVISLQGYMMDVVRKDELVSVGIVLYYFILTLKL